jgi:hypothetical protein
MEHSQKQSPAKRKSKGVLGPLEANLYAQKLNNSGAFCIEIGEYDRAIVSLGKALKLSELHRESDLADACLCPNCTIEGCIAHSETIPSGVNSFLAGGISPLPLNRNVCSHQNKKPRLEQPPPNPLFKSHFAKLEEDEIPLGSVYRRPIQVTPRSIREAHNMGSTLFLIIIFNLALAHHGALAATSSSTWSEETRRSKLKTTLRLYELADGWYKRDKKRRFTCSSTNINSSQVEEQHIHTDRFAMIICNNTSHIHRLLNDTSKYQDCLHKLTSALMVEVDHKKSAVQQHGQQSNQQLGEDTHCDDSDGDSTESGDNHLEEFLRTASQLILHNQCADAA